jgi:hypothetical protein
VSAYLLALIVTVSSHHFNDVRDYNPFNPGLGIVVKLPYEWKLNGGQFYNSHKNNTWFVTVGRESDETRWAGLGIEVGVLTGYYGHRLLPMAAPYFRLGRSRLNLKLSILPVPRPIIGLQVRIGLRPH